MSSISQPPQHDPDPELEDIRGLGVVEGQHDRAAGPFGGSGRSIGLVWLIPAAILVVALVALFLVMR